MIPAPVIAPPATVPAGKTGARGMSSGASPWARAAPVMAPPAIVPAPKLGAIRGWRLRTGWAPLLNWFCLALRIVPAGKTGASV